MELLAVRCYAGYKGVERPVAVRWRGEWRSVAKVLERCYEPGGSAFKVMLDGGIVRLLLRYDPLADRWEGEEIAVHGKARRL